MQKTRPAHPAAARYFALTAFCKLWYAQSDLVYFVLHLKKEAAHSMKHIRFRRVWLLCLSLLLLVCVSVSARADTNWFCLYCGRENIPAYSYCPDCGTARGTSRVVVCGNCGTEITVLEGYRYCPNCGSPISADLRSVATPVPRSTTAPRPTATPRPTAVPRSTAAPLSIRPSAAVFSWYSETTRYYYNQLTTQEKQLFSLLYDGIMNFETVIPFPDGFTVSMYNRVINVIRFDCPEIIQCSKYTYYYRDEALVRAEPQYCLTRDAYAQHWSAIQSAVQGMRSLPGFSASDYSKEFAIYRYIIEHCSYQIDEPATVYADSVYWYGRAQCCGYVRALNLALRYYGIPCLHITGYTYTNGQRNDDRGHDWTMARIDGEWYHCDATWDDPTWERSDHPAAFPGNGNAYLKYFNQTDEFMLKNRTMDDLGFTRPACYSVSGNYAYREGIYVSQWTEDPVSYVKYQIIARRDQGLKTITIQFETAAVYETVYSRLNDGIINRLKNAGSYRWWYDKGANFLYIIVP